MTVAVNSADAGSAADASPLVLESFLWGLLSASSLNIGSIIGVTCLPSQKIRAMLMAFGGGALLFALSVELFGHVLHKFEQESDSSIVWTMEGSAVFGGLLFASLNYVLNQAGADVRKPSTRMGTIARLRGLLMRRLTRRLQKVNFFSVLSYNELTMLIQKGMYKQRFTGGDMIMSQSDDAGVYFIISGCVRLVVHEQTSPTAAGKTTELRHEVNNKDKSTVVALDDFDAVMRMQKSHDDDGCPMAPKLSGHTWELGPNQIFGDMPILTGSHIGAEVYALEPTKVLVLPPQEVSYLLATNNAVRQFVSAVEQLKQVDELKHLPDHTLTALAAHCSHAKFLPGDTLFSGAVKHDTCLICIIVGTVERTFESQGNPDVFESGCLLCTEHLNKGKESRPFTAVALDYCSVLFLERHVLDELSRSSGASVVSFGDNLGWNGVDETAEKDVICRKRRRRPFSTSSGSDEDMLSSMTDDDMSDADRFQKPYVDPWMAAMLQSMQGVHNQAIDGKSARKREKRIQSEAVVERQVSDLNDKAKKAKADGREMKGPSNASLKKPTPVEQKHTSENADANAAHGAEGGDEAKPSPPQPGHDSSKGHEAEGKNHGHTAIMVWLGILIDAVPESLVIGILVNKSVISGESSASVALPFVISVFLSNLPEAMSSAGSMKSHGMRVSHILLMWFLTTFVTAIGALVGAVIFPPDAIENHDTQIIVSAVEGVAAGAMLTMIAQTMMPEAFEQGGDIVGLSCLAGFLCAMSVKLIPT